MRTDWSAGRFNMTCEKTVRIPYRTKVFIGINVREIRDCQNRERFKPTKNNFQQALDA